jgi:hypothetical protein
VTQEKQTRGKLAAPSKDQDQAGGTVMTKALLFALALLFSAAWLQAQDASHSESRQTQTSASSQTILQGCVEGSDGDYILTDKFGRTYHLASETSKPAAYVGREVQVTTSTPAAIVLGSSLGSEQSGEEQPIVEVEAIKNISAACRVAE